MAVSSSTGVRDYEIEPHHSREDKVLVQSWVPDETGSAGRVENERQEIYSYEELGNLYRALRDFFVDEPRHVE